MEDKQARSRRKPPGDFPYRFASDRAQQPRLLEVGAVDLGQVVSQQKVKLPPKRGGGRGLLELRDGAVAKHLACAGPLRADGEEQEQRDGGGGDDDDDDNNDNTRWVCRQEPGRRPPPCTYSMT